MTVPKQKHNLMMQESNNIYDNMNEEQLLLYLFPANLQDLRMAAKKLRGWVAPERIRTVGPDEQLIIQAFRAHLGEIEFVMDFGDEIFEIGKLYEDQEDALRYVLQLMHGFCAYYMNCRLRFAQDVSPLISIYEKNNPQTNSEVVDLAITIVIEALMNADPTTHNKNSEDISLEKMPYILPDEVKPQEIKDDFLDSIEMIQAFQDDLSKDMSWIEAHFPDSHTQKTEFNVELDIEFFLRTLDFLQLASSIIQELNEQNGFEIVAYLLYAFSQFVFAVNTLYEDFIQGLESELNSSTAETESNFSDEVKRIIEERWGYNESDEATDADESDAEKEGDTRVKRSSGSARRPRRLSNKRSRKKEK